MTDNPYESPPPPVESPRRKPRGWKPALIELLMIVFIAGMLAALLLPVTRMVVK
jgi:hypothetical protein